MQGKRTIKNQGRVARRKEHEMSMNRRQNSGGLRWIAPIWVLACTLACNPAGADAAADPEGRILWSAQDQGLVLYQGQRTGGHEVCPRVPGMSHQPFCRTFKSPVLGACGLHNGLQVVLANGDVHQLNSALLSAGGSFEPAHRPDRPLDLAEAWMPERAHQAGQGLSDVLAVATSGDLWHFNGKHWQQISSGEAGLLH